MDMYIKAGSPDTWVRPGGWVSIPSITSADTKFYGVYAVYETRKNNVYIGFAGSAAFNCTVNWGDGTSNTVVSSVSTISHTFTYAGLTSPILVDEYGENYKTVLVTITQNSGALAQFNFGSTTSIGTYNWLDIVMSWSTARVQFLKSHPLLQRFIQYTGTWAGANINSYIQYLSRCRVFQIPPTNLGPLTQGISVFSFLGDCEIGDLIISGTGSLTSLFTNSLVRKVGNLNFSATLAGNALFQGCFNLRQVGDVNVAASPNLSVIFQLCPNLVKIGTITSTAATNLTSTFNGCSSLREITFTNIAAVTSMSGTFNFCHSLENLRVPGVIITFSVIDCAMERAALVQVFNDLGTPGTTRTITVSRNPGSADLTAADILIATSKNWIVTL